MNHETFQRQFDLELSTFAQTIQTSPTIRQHERIGTLCERLYLHALASHTFRRLAEIDPANRAQHGTRFLYNLREASGHSVSVTCSAIYN